MNATAKMIVAAWVENDGMVATGRMERFDGVNYRPEYVPCPKPRALVWLKKGTDADATKAAEFIAAQHAADALAHAVFTYPTTEKDPLGRARRDVMALVTTASA